MAEAPAAARSDFFVSVVTVLDETAPSVAEFVRAVQTDLAARYTNYEVLLVDSGLGPDQLADLRALLGELPCIRVLRLTRRVGFDNAVFAGIESAVGDFVVVMSPVHDPVAAIADVVDLGREGNDIVQGLSTVPIATGWFAGLGRRAFFWYNRRFLGVDIPPRATSLTGLSRRAVNSLTASSRSHRYLRHLIRHIGFRPAAYEYTPRENPTSSRRSVQEGYNEAIEMISSYSTHPLRAVTILGVAAGLLNLLYAVYVVVIRLVLDSVAEGWTTTSLQLSLMFFIISIIIAIQSEYIGRILTETRREPAYFIMEELESETLIADLERRNVSD